LIRHIQQPSDNRPLAKNGPYLTYSTTYSGDYIVSTTGKISQFTSAVDEDLSERIVEEEVDIIHPYTLGFNPLANVIESDGRWDLDRLTDDSQICSLGSETTTGH